MEQLKVFAHQLYECRKGVRSMALCTLYDDLLVIALNKIKVANLSHFVYPVTDNKYNLFFGKKECIQMVEQFCNKPLNQLSIEEDFMLGAILGYGIEEQCQRYLFKKKQFKKASKISKLKY
ncbi:MAG: DUF2023 family protein [Bacteroidales bacterium]|nr:DUF2023 family protein [Bacteroidales bacterium]